MSGALDLAGQAAVGLGAITDQGYTGSEAFFGIGGVAAAVIFASNSDFDLGPSLTTFHRHRLSLRNNEVKCWDMLRGYQPATPDSQVHRPSDHGRDPGCLWAHRRGYPSDQRLVIHRVA